MLDIIKSTIRPKPPIVIIHSGTNVISGMNTTKLSNILAGIKEINGEWETKLWFSTIAGIAFQVFRHISKKEDTASISVRINIIPRAIFLKK